MTFISLHFLVFFMVVTLWFFDLKNQKSRVLLLLIASCYFYMSFIPVYILILGGTIVVDYFAGIRIEVSSGRARKSWLIASIVANIGALAVFKYYNFFIYNISSGFSWFGKPLSLPLLQMALPIGLSFHTFQALSYTIEVYRGNFKAERSFITYALYVMFYPQLVAGPIERPQHVLPQLKEFRPYNWQNVKDGLMRMAWGFFKKAVIADRLAMVVERTYTHVGETSSMALLAGAVCYSFQIYCDFSGYSDIALGAAKVMNITLMENFDQPYLANNIRNFWSRWHISLSSWFRDYVYIPLGGNRVGSIRHKLNIIIVFLLSGLWHGANWTFVIWGLLHGIFVLLVHRSATVSRDLQRTQLRHIPAIALNFILVTFLWVFFRAQNLTEALAYIKKIIQCRPGSNYVQISPSEMAFSILLIVIMIVKERYFSAPRVANNTLFFLLLTAMVIIVYYFGVFVENRFIYFQF